MSNSRTRLRRCVARSALRRRQSSHSRPWQSLWRHCPQRRHQHQHHRHRPSLHQHQHRHQHQHQRQHRQRQHRFRLQLLRQHLLAHLNRLVDVGWRSNHTRKLFNRRLRPLRSRKGTTCNWSASEQLQPRQSESGNENETETHNASVSGNVRQMPRLVRRDTCTCTRRQSQ